MSFKKYLYRAISLKPSVLMSKIIELSLLKIGNRVAELKARFRPTYFQSGRIDSSDFREVDFFKSEGLPEDQLGILSDVTQRHVKHEFDVLGSGWVSAAYGLERNGFLGRRFSSTDCGEVNQANQRYSAFVSKLICPSYEFIDWHTDLKSGYSWNRSHFFTKIEYGKEEGVDIKIPWELSRLQHLPQLVVQYRESKDQKLAQEVKNQILDFIAHNPPLFGVNWFCAMDVAIRAANISLVVSQLLQEGFEFSSNELKVIGSSLYDHYELVKWRNEKKVDFTGNHYLANVAGMVFLTTLFKPLACYRDYWVKELLEQYNQQFLEDGANFEGSTSYHRLSVELCLYSFYLLESDGYDLDWESIKSSLYSKLNFMEVVTDFENKIVQIGDTDSGRFLNFGPQSQQKGNCLNHRPTMEAILAFCGASFVPKTIEGYLLKPGSFVKKPMLNTQMEEVKGYEYKRLKLQNEYVFNHSEVDLLSLEMFTFTDFGLVVAKSDNYFLSYRCGAIGQNGKGGHDHNDQLSISLKTKKCVHVYDPGTYVYTANSEIRNAYRSVESHFSPQFEGIEPSHLDEGLFYLGRARAGQLLSVKKGYILGRYKAFNYDDYVYREVEIQSDKTVIRDYYSGQKTLKNLSDHIHEDRWAAPVDFSPGYGFVVPQHR